MVHGKKGFGRLEWAAKNVLNQSLTWLFYNFNPNSREALVEGREPISVHAPAVREIAPSVRLMEGVLVPELTVDDLPRLYEQEESLELLEWLDMVSLDSPRIREGDRIDPFLSRYEVPDFGKGVEVRDMVRVRWRGFIPPLFVRELFLAVRKEGLKVGRDEHDGEGGTMMGEEKRWFAMSAQGFEESEGYTVMQWAGRETLCWEVL
jgi:ribonuclease P/MRP protein subunit RPP40